MRYRSKVLVGPGGGAQRECRDDDGEIARRVLNLRSAVVEHRRAGQVVRTPAFEAAGVLAWAFTALVLDGLFDALGWTVPWTADRIVVPR